MKMFSAFKWYIWIAIPKYADKHDWFTHVTTVLCVVVTLGSCESRNLPVLLLTHLGPVLILMMEQLQRAHGALGMKPHWTLTCQEKM